MLRKIMFTRAYPSFTENKNYIKVGIDGVVVTWACLHDSTSRYDRIQVSSKTSKAQNSTQMRLIHFYFISLKSLDLQENTSLFSQNIMYVLGDSF